MLAQKALPIERVEKTLFRLADDMLETMYDAPGVGLAANQVGILKRILVMDTDYEVDEENQGGSEGEGVMPAGPAQSTEVVGGIIKNKKPIIIINPRIIRREGEIFYKEGCLSVPEYSAEVKRSEKIVIEYQDIDGLTHEMKLEGLPAVCIQHEMDHLDGKLFIERLSPLKQGMVQKKLLKERDEREKSRKKED